VKKISKAEYRVEANAWRRVAVLWLVATRGNGGKFYIGGNAYDDGLCLTFSHGPTQAEREEFPLILNRMRIRLARYRPTRVIGSYWFNQRTQAGRQQRVDVALACAIDCDRLAGDK
jgi:hypothetical protein